jgi:hypothetical protein
MAVEETRTVPHPLCYEYHLEMKLVDISPRGKYFRACPRLSETRLPYPLQRPGWILRRKFDTPDPLPSRGIAVAFRSDLHECSQPHEFRTSSDQREQPEHVWRAAIRADCGKRRKPDWPSGTAARLLTSINGGQNGIATAICGDPNSFAKSRLSENCRRPSGDNCAQAPILKKEQCLGHGVVGPHFRK